MGSSPPISASLSGSAASTAALKGDNQFGDNISGGKNNPWLPLAIIVGLFVLAVLFVAKKKS